MKKPLSVLMSIGIITSLLSVPLIAQASHRNSVTENNINTLDGDIVENLPIPVLFGVAVQNLTKNYGDPRAGHTHIGLDIMAPEGTPIVSPTDAVVTSKGVWTGAGNYVSTKAPGGERFVYMHLSEIADISEGDLLKVGDIVGYVGHTGNAIASAPHLHFEIHDDNDATSDPYPRFTKVFTLKEKMTYLQEILDEHDDQGALVELLVATFRTELVAARTQGLAVPKAINEKLGGTVAVPAPSVSVSPTETLKLGSRGYGVKVLQEYLIKKNIGSASRIVADGVFGPLTRQAVIEFQKSAGLVADGIYGAKSRAYALQYA